MIEKLETNGRRQNNPITTSNMRSDDSNAQLGDGGNLEQHLLLAYDRQSSSKMQTKLIGTSDKQPAGHQEEEKQAKYWAQVAGKNERLANDDDACNKQQEFKELQQRQELTDSLQQQQPPPSLSSKLRTLVGTLVARKKETKMDNLEAMINESALKLLQQKEMVFKQGGGLQLDQLCKTTKFNRRELKWLYSGWKVACTDGCGVSTDSLGGSEVTSYGSYSLSSAYYGIINENQFQQIYAQFFPYGGDCSYYARYVFQAMFGDTLNKNGGFITFADYAHALSSLLRGSVEEKINFVFRLYDVNGDDVITLDELSKILFAVYRLLGDNVNQKHDQLTYEQQAEKLYRKIDFNQTGAITKDLFMQYCIKDSTIVDTIKMLEMSICSGA